MAEPIEVLEQRIEGLRTQVRRALMAGDRAAAQSLRRELHAAERAWDAALGDLDGDHRDVAGPWPATPGAPGSSGHDASGQAPREAGQRPARAAAPPGGMRGAPPGGLLLPLREQVHQALTLLTVPAAPGLISAVHEAFFAGAVPASRLTSVRRDEERSFRSAPFARPYYLCAALTADLLAPARGLLAVSTWEMERRVIGPLSPRVDFLTAALAVAGGIQRIPDPGPAGLRLLWRFAVNIPGTAQRAGTVDPRAVARAAQAELEIHADADGAARRSAAMRARGQLDDAGQLFGSRLRISPQGASAG